MIENINSNYLDESHQFDDISEFTFVYQANDLAGALGKLTVLEQKLFDFCTSFIQDQDTGQEVHSVSLTQMIHALDLKDSGTNDKRVATAYLRLIKQVFFKWNEATESFKPFSIFNFEHTEYFPKKRIAKFSFSKAIRPYLYFLKHRYYAYPLLITKKMKSKYSIIMVRLMAAADNGQQTIKLYGSLDQWEAWMGLKDEHGNNKYTASKFTQRVLKVFLAELRKEFSHYTFIVKKKTNSKHRIVGYFLIIKKDSFVVQLKNPLSDKMIAIKSSNNLMMHNKKH